jgi:hypothetical protein
MIKRTMKEWNDLFYELQDHATSNVRRAEVEALEEKLEQALNDLENPKKDPFELKVAQGERKAYKCAIMLLGDLLRQSERNRHPRKGEPDA